MNRIPLSHPLALAPVARPRLAMAQLLRRTGRTLVRLSRRLRPGRLPSPDMAPEPLLEFYAEAGAPEGALYVDGRRVGVLPGVTRL